MAFSDAAFWAKILPNLPGPIPRLGLGSGLGLGVYYCSVVLTNKPWKP